MNIRPTSSMQWVRVRQRQVSFRVSSSDVGVGWRFGTMRTDMRLDGRQ